MRALTAAVGLFCLVSATSARADEVKDLDKWAAQFAEAAGRSDAAAMNALIEPYAKYGSGIAKIEEVLPKAIAGFAGAKVIHVEQFNNTKVGSFARRIGVAVIYDNGQEFYTLTFIKGETGWRFYQIDVKPDIAGVPGLTWQ